jgi:hypothetical protein
MTACLTGPSSGLKDLLQILTLDRVAFQTSFIDGDRDEVPK